MCFSPTTHLALHYLSQPKVENGEKGGRVASRAAFLEQLSCRSTCCRAVQRGRGWDAPNIRRRGVGDISSSGSGAARKRALSPPRGRRDLGKVRTPAPVLGLLSSIQSREWQATGCRGRSGPTWLTCRPVGPAQKRGAALRQVRYDRAELHRPPEQGAFSPLNHEDSACAGAPSPPASSSLTRALSLCRPAGLNVDGGRGLRAKYVGDDGDGGHLGYLRLELRTSLLQLFAVKVAARSEGVASVRGDSAAIACRAHVGPGNRVCMVCGPSREVVGRCIRLDTNVNS